MAKADLESYLGLTFKCGLPPSPHFDINVGRFGSNLFFLFIQCLLYLSTALGVGDPYSLEDISPSGACVVGETQESQ